MECIFDVGRQGFHASSWQVQVAFLIGGMLVIAYSVYSGRPGRPANAAPNFVMIAGGALLAVVGASQLWASYGSFLSLSADLRFGRYQTVSGIATVIPENFLKGSFHPEYLVVGDKFFYYYTGQSGAGFHWTYYDALDTGIPQSRLQFPYGVLRSGMFLTLDYVGNNILRIYAKTNDPHLIGNSCS